MVREVIVVAPALSGSESVSEWSELKAGMPAFILSEQ